MVISRPFSWGFGTTLDMPESSKDCSHWTPIQVCFQSVSFLFSAPFVTPSINSWSFYNHACVLVSPSCDRVYVSIQASCGRSEERLLLSIRLPRALGVMKRLGQEG